MKVEHLEAFNFEGAFRGLRNPKNSWHLSDSHWDDEHRNYILGPKDINLAQRMITAGASDRKFLRQIFVSMDIVAPSYWVAEHDTYKIATVRNSCSFMHKGCSKEYDISDFAVTEEEYLADKENWDRDIKALNELRTKYLETKDERIFREIRKKLPSAYNYRFTWTGNYETLRNMYFQRRYHRLPEWHEFLDYIKQLPYAEELIMYEVDNGKQTS